MVKRKRSQIEIEDEESVLESNNNQPKKRKIKSNGKRNTKPVNKVISKKKNQKNKQTKQKCSNNIVNENTNNSLSDSMKTQQTQKIDSCESSTEKVPQLSLFKSCTKVKKSKIKKTKVISSNKSFMSLTKNDDFSELQLRCYFLKINFIRNSNILLINVIVDDINGDCEKYLTLLSTRNNHVLHHQDKYEINKYYMISGGHIGVYRGRRQINITAHTKIELCKNQNLKPVYDFMQISNKLLSDFTKVKTEAADKVQTQYLVGWLYEIHEEIHYSQQKAICLPITIMDSNGIGLKINLWNDFDRNQVKSVKLNCSVICTAWSLKQNGELYSVSNNGFIFYDVNVPVQRKQNKLVDNLSDVGSESIVNNAIPITFKEMLNGINGSSQAIYFYKLENVRIVQIERLFRFKDENGVDLNESMSGVIDNDTGESRSFNVIKDSIEYFIKCKVQDIDSNVFVYMNGFKTAGESIFNCKSNELYDKYIATQQVNLQSLSDQVSLQGLNVIVRPYINRNKRLYWTLTHVYENWTLDE